ncbi:MAG: VOC family protein [Chitinophagales bacterium]
MATLNPYVHFNGNCEAAFTLYKEVFGGEFVTFMRYSDGPQDGKLSDEELTKIMHVSLPIGSSTLMGSDIPGNYPPATIGNNFYISVDATSKEEADRLFAGLSKNGKVQMPMADTFWGSYFGMCTDAFNVGWMISYAQRRG